MMKVTRAFDHLSHCFFALNLSLHTFRASQTNISQINKIYSLSNSLRQGCPSSVLMSPNFSAAFGYIFSSTHLSQMNGLLPSICRAEWLAYEGIHPFDSGVLEQGCV
ncbi:hypothetical protein AMECASPLE_001649 [Ameca splendens]|uniref:Uncharacterized protein n=1 Tax=Ameca splendens TaxID=208324 RepID=A0ABV0YK49_9TELE